MSRTNSPVTLVAGERCMARTGHGSQCSRRRTQGVFCGQHRDPRFPESYRVDRCERCKGEKPPSQQRKCDDCHARMLAIERLRAKVKPLMARLREVENKAFHGRLTEAYDLAVDALVELAELAGVQSRTEWAASNPAEAWAEVLAAGQALAESGTPVDVGGVEHLIVSAQDRLRWNLAVSKLGRLA